MNLRSCKDHQILMQIKVFVQAERDSLVKILHHLREIERRRLFSDLGYSSLFDYTLHELKYSEGQACRRISAMRLIKDVPEVESKISTGELSLSNVQQAQTLFRDLQNTRPEKTISKNEKLAVLAKLENKSVREGQKELLKLQPQAALPKERERPVSESTTEVKFLINEQLKAKLEEIRSLLGPRGTAMSYAELFDALSDVSLAALKAQRFGKRRVESTAAANAETSIVKESNMVNATSSSSYSKAKSVAAAPPTSAVKASQNQRYIPKAMKWQVWQRDQGRCCRCRGTRNLHYDHIRPIALGGRSELSNLRLLCFHCNLRAGAKTFGWQDRRRQSKPLPMTT